MGRTASIEDKCVGINTGFWTEKGGEEVDEEVEEVESRVFVSLITDIFSTWAVASISISTSTSTGIATETSGSKGKKSTDKRKPSYDPPPSYPSLMTILNPTSVVIPVEG